MKYLIGWLQAAVHVFLGEAGLLFLFSFLSFFSCERGLHCTADGCNSRYGAAGQVMYGWSPLMKSTGSEGESCADR